MKTWRLVLLVFVLAAAVRVGFVLTLDPQKLYWWDEGEFDRIAWNLAQGQGYVAEPHRANPVLPATMAAAYAAFGHSFVAARIVQAVLGAGLCALVFLIADVMVSRRAAVISGTIAAFYPHLIYVTGVFYAANLLAFWLAASVALLCLAMQRRTWLWAAASGAAAAVAVLTRPVCTPFVPVAAALVLFRRPVGGGDSRAESGENRWGSAAAFLLAAAIVLTPWCVRNARVYGRFIFVATGGGKAFWMGNNALSRGDADDRYLDIYGATWLSRLEALPEETRRSVRHSHDLLAKELEPLDRVDQDRCYRRRALQYVAAHPFRAAVRSLRRIGTLYSAATPTRTRTSHASLAKRLVAGLTFYPVVALGLLGAFLYRREWRRLLPVLGLIAAYSLSYAVLTASTRFRIPIDFCWIVLAGAAASRFPLGRSTDEPAPSG